MSKTRKMRKHRTSKKSFLRNVKNTTKKVVPEVTSGLKTIGKSVKNLTMQTKPVIEKGLAAIYNTTMSGFDLGVKGIKKGIHIIKTKKSKKSRKSRK